MATTYVTKTLDRFKKANRYYWRVEHWNQYANDGIGLRQDAFGFIDYLVIDPFDGIVAVQICGPGEHQEHKRKILRNEFAARWINFCKIELWSWSKVLLKRGGKKRVWQPHIETITLDMFKEFADDERSAGQSVCSSERRGVPVSRP